MHSLQEAGKERSVRKGGKIKRNEVCEIMAPYPSLTHTVMAAPANKSERNINVVFHTQ